MKKEIGKIKESIKDIKSIERIVNFSIRGNSNEVLSSDPDLYQMMNDYSVYLSNQEFLDKWYSEKKFTGMHADEEFDENGNMDEFRVTEEYYVTFKDGSEIYVSFSSEGDFIDAGIRDYEEAKGKMAEKWLPEFENRHGWDTDIDSLMEEVMGVKKEKGGKLKNKYEYYNGDVVWDIGNKSYGVVLNNFDDPINGDSGDVRLDSDGMQSIYKYDEKWENRIGYNLVPYGSKEDKGDGDLSEVKASGKRLIDSNKDFSTARYKEYSLIYCRLLSGEFDEKKSSGGSMEKGGSIAPNLLLELWFAVHGKETDKYKSISEKLDKEGVSFSIQNKVSKDAEEMRHKKVIDTFEAKERVGKIMESSGGAMAKGGLTPAKARIMLHEGKAGGKNISEKQRRYFGAVASGYAKKGSGGDVSALDGTKKYKYGITFRTITEESAQQSDWAKTGWEIKTEDEELQYIIKTASWDYGINYFTGSGWESTSPTSDRDYFEKGIEKYYDLHIKHTDGSELSKEEEKSITDLLRSNKVKYDEDEKSWYGKGGSTNKSNSTTMDKTWIITGGGLAKPLEIIGGTKESAIENAINTLRPIFGTQPKSKFMAVQKKEKGGSAGSIWDNFWSSFANDGALITSGGYFTGGEKKEKGGKAGKDKSKEIKKRLEELRKELRAERISYGELFELQSLAEYIDSGDVELLEAAGVPEFPDDDSKEKGGKAEGRIITFDDGFQFRVVDFDYAKKNWQKEQIYKIYEDEQTESLIDDIRSVNAGDVLGVEAGFKKEKGGTTYAQQRVPMTKRGKQIDGKVKALKAGWRISKETGNEYYENRINRSDKNPSKKI